MSIEDGSRHIVIPADVINNYSYVSLALNTDTEATKFNHWSNKYINISTADYYVDYTYDPYNTAKSSGTLTTQKISVKSLNIEHNFNVRVGGNQRFLYVKLWK